VQIREGDAVVVWLASANRDEEVFADPYRFDPARTPNRHLAFGVGPHYCVGHAVARLALRVVLGEIASTLAGVELGGPVEHLASNFIAGIRRMPVVPHPRASRASTT
jgi:cytochrome P450